MDAKDCSIRGHQVHICVGLFFIHLCEGGEELLEMLCRGRIAMRSLGPVDEGHLGAVLVVPAAVLAS